MCGLVLLRPLNEVQEQTGLRNRSEKTAKDLKGHEFFEIRISRVQKNL